MVQLGADSTIGSREEHVIQAWLHPLATAISLEMGTIKLRNLVLGLLTGLLGRDHFSLH